MDGVLFTLKARFRACYITHCISCLFEVNSSEQYMLKNESFYPLLKFKGKPPVFMKLS